MPRLHANGIDIEYETQGDPKDPPMLMIMGLGAQLITWDDELIEQLADRGFYVIRYDNRDSGLSTKMDAAGVLDALHIRAAHIVGASMGGFIAQLVAINHPEHTLSLTSIMSGPGGHDAIPPTPEASVFLVGKPGPNKADVIEFAVASKKILGGEGNPFDAELERAKAERAYERSYYPAGFGRQLVAILASKTRIPALRELKVPTLVIHGADDPLIPPENGRRVAAAVPGARYIELPGAGHNLPPGTWKVVVDAIVENAKQASAASRR